VGDLLAFSVFQAALLLAVAVVVGQWAAWKLGLGTPLIVALLTCRPAPEKALPTLLLAFTLGGVTALALMMLDRWVFVPIPSVAELLHSAETGSVRTSAWQGFLGASRSLHLSLRPSRCDASSVQLCASPYRL
jgi:hypothetical protein